MRFFSVLLRFSIAPTPMLFQGWEQWCWSIKRSCIIQIKTEHAYSPLEFLGKTRGGSPTLYNRHSRSGSSHLLLVPAARSTTAFLLQEKMMGLSQRWLQVYFSYLRVNPGLQWWYLVFSSWTLNFCRNLSMCTWIWLSYYGASFLIHSTTQLYSSFYR